MGNNPVDQADVFWCKSANVMQPAVIANSSTTAAGPLSKPHFNFSSPESVDVASTKIQDLPSSSSTSSSNTQFKRTHPPIPARPKPNIPPITSASKNISISNQHINNKNDDNKNIDNSISSPPPKNNPSSIPPIPHPQPRPRKPTDNNSMSTQDIISRLQPVCKMVDPNTVYTNFQKIGQGASGGVFTATLFSTQSPGVVVDVKNDSISNLVAIKQMNLDQQPKKELILNEILVMKESKHKNIVNYIDSFLWNNDLWVCLN